LGLGGGGVPSFREHRPCPGRGDSTGEGTAEGGDSTEGRQRRGEDTAESGQ
jgi:hypothetical protein